MSYDTLLVARDGAVATVTLHRPERLNALNRTMLDELLDAFPALASDPDVRAIVLQGAGGTFCGGGEVGTLRESGTLGAVEREEFARLADQLIVRIWQIDKPVIAAVRGPAIGGGCCLTLPCDVRIAAADARLGFVFVKRGLSGADMGASWFLQRLVGVGMAAELLLTGDIIDAPTAKAIGLVNRVVPLESFEGAVQEMAAKMAAGPPAALRMTKRAIRVASTTDMVSALEYEDLVQTFCLQTKDFAEGVRSFVEKRAAKFTGE